MKCLDLFCCDGGAAMGLHNAGFDEIVGIDIAPHPNYPFEFIQADCLQLPISDFSEFNLIWASPPCQNYSVGTLGWRNAGKEYPDLVAGTRKLLQSTKKPYVIENVPNAPIKKHLLLCGEMFGLKVFRHRHFEINGFRVEQPKHIPHKGTVSNGNKISVMTGGAPGCFGDKEKREKIRKYYSTVAGHGGDGSGAIKVWQEAMGINWITNKKFLAEAVPPAYSEYIGKEFIRYNENITYANSCLPKQR